MLSHKRFIKLSQGIVGALAGGPSPGSKAATNMNGDAIAGIKTGGYLAVQLYAAAYADEMGIDKFDVFEEIGLPRTALGSGGEAQLNKIVQNSRVEDDTSVVDLLRRSAT